MAKIKLKQSFLTVLTTIFFLAPASWAVEATLSVAKLQVAYLGKQGPSRFAEVQKYFEQSKNCKICEIKDVSVYLASGDLDREKTIAKWNNENLQFPIILVDWNEKLTDESKSVINILNKQVASGSSVVISAGRAENLEPTLAINKTMAAQISQALILGEMTDRERILPNAYYGPEILTALRLSPGLANQNMAPVVFVTRWVSNWTKRNQYEWPSYLRSRKEKIKKIWPTLDDLF